MPQLIIDAYSRPAAGVSWSLHHPGKGKAGRGGWGRDILLVEVLVSQVPPVAPFPTAHPSITIRGLGSPVTWRG